MTGLRTGGGGGVAGGVQCGEVGVRLGHVPRESEDAADDGKDDPQNDACGNEEGTDAHTQHTQPRGRHLLDVGCVVGCVDGGDDGDDGVIVRLGSDVCRLWQL